MLTRCPFTRQRCYQKECACWNYESETCGLICPLVPDYGADLRKLIVAIENAGGNLRGAIKGEY